MVTSKSRGMRLSASEGRECPMYFATMQKHAHSMRDAGCNGGGVGGRMGSGGGSTKEYGMSGSRLDGPSFSFFSFFLLF